MSILQRLTLSMFIVTGGANGTVKLWSAATGQETLTLKAHKGGVGGIAFSPDGQRIITGGDDGTAKIWESGTGQEVLTLKGHTGEMRSVAFSPDGQHLLTGDKAAVKVWSATPPLP